MGQVFQNLVQLFEESVAKHADRDLFGVKQQDSWEWLTYREFGRQVDAVRSGLAARGIAAGDRVAMIADNRVEWAAACYATLGLGAVFVPMYRSQLPGEWEYILRDSAARLVFASDRLVVQKLGPLRRTMPTLQHLISLEGPDGGPDTYDGLLSEGLNAPSPAIRPSGDDLAGLIYTSGTTGSPKGVMLSHRNITSNINAVHEIFTFDPDERSLAFLPWAHSFGQTCELHGLLSMGCSIAINDEIPKLIDNLREVRPTILFAVPRIFNRIHHGVNEQISERPAVVQWLVRSGIESAKRKALGESVGLLGEAALWLADTLAFSKIRDRFGGRLKFTVSGSAALSPEVASFVDALGIMVYEGYGLTETSPIATANFPGARKIGSVGKAIPGVRIEIDRSVAVTDDDDRVGEIVVHGPNVMSGYYGLPEETAAVVREDGGLRTGDLGRLDEDGFLFITGRIKEQYKLENGKYVVPSPLEEKIKLSPLVANVFVFGENRPHNVALVVLDPVALAERAELRGIEPAQPGRDEVVRALIAKEIEGCLRDAKGYELVKNFAIVEDDFTVENGLLTPTLKLRRQLVQKRYGKLLDDLYRSR